MKGIIFDLDGVIVHTDHYHYLAWKKMCDLYGFVFDEEINQHLRGISRMDSLEIILSYNNVEYSLKEKLKMTELKNEYYLMYLRDLNQKNVDDEVLDTLRVLKNRGYKIAIGSSSRNAKMILKNIGLLDFFDAISDGTNITKTKPDPEVFIKASELLGLDASDCYVVEDAIAGLKAARSGGMISIGIYDAYQCEFADYSAQSFKTLLEIIE